MTPAAVLRRCVAACGVALLAAVAAAGAARAAALQPWTQGETPPLVLEDLSGKKHDLARYRGKVVLVNFWATWCGPCREEMPSMERLRERHGAGPFAVLAVNADEPEQRIRAFLERTPLEFTVLTDPGMRATRRWGARVLPASYLIGRDGRIRYSVRGAVDWSSDAIARIVAELMKQPG